MEKITLRELTDFRKKSDRSKKSFALKLKKREPKPKETKDDGGGGDYWITSTSCIYNVFKQNDLTLYDSKIDELHRKVQDTEHKIAKDMFKKNIEILSNFKDFEFSDVRPNYDLNYKSIPQNHKVITIDDFPVFVNPGALFSYEKNGKTELGALWLTTIKEGYKKDELGMFCEMLYKFLSKNYSENYQLSTDYCIVIDTFSGRKIAYTELVNGDVPFLIKKTLEEIKML